MAGSDNMKVIINLLIGYPVRQNLQNRFYQMNYVHAEAAKNTVNAMEKAFTVSDRDDDD